MIVEVIRGVGVRTTTEGEYEAEYQIVGRSWCVGAGDAASVGTRLVGEDRRN